MTIPSSKYNPWIPATLDLPANNYDDIKACVRQAMALHAPESLSGDNLSGLSKGSPSVPAPASGYTFAKNESSSDISTEDSGPAKAPNLPANAPTSLETLTEANKPAGIGSYLPSSLLPEVMNHLNFTPHSRPIYPPPNGVWTPDILKHALDHVWPLFQENPVYNNRDNYPRNAWSVNLNPHIGCTPSQSAQIDQATSAAQQAAIGQNLGSQFSNIIDNTPIGCRPPALNPDNRYCGLNETLATDYENNIYLMDAFNKGCGPLQSTLWHEISHSPGLRYSEGDAFALEHKSYGRPMPTPEQFRQLYDKKLEEDYQRYQQQYNKEMTK